MTNETKVFGLEAEKGRWVFVLIGLIINISLGAVYAWSVFRKPLESLFHAGATESGMPFMFFLAFFALIVLLAMLLKFPPIGWKPRGWTSNAAALSCGYLSTSQMLRTSSFYGLWLCYVIGTLSGLMAIGIANSVGQEIVKLDATVAAIAVSVFAVFNGAGRPIFGWLTDRIKPKYSAVASFVLVFFASVGMLFVGKADIVLYVIFFSIFWLCLGGWLAIAPASLCAFFGTGHHGKNYGVIFTAYGLGAILGTLMSGMVKDKFGSYTNVFYLTAGLAVVGIIIAILFLKQPKAESEYEVKGVRYN